MYTDTLEPSLKYDFSLGCQGLVRGNSIGCDNFSAIGNFVQALIAISSEPKQKGVSAWGGG